MATGKSRRWTSGALKCRPMRSTLSTAICERLNVSMGSPTKSTSLLRSTPPLAEMAPDRSVRFPFIVVASAIAATAYRLVLAVDRYSVNILFWDQWDFYTPLFDHAYLWQIFTWQ